MESENCSLGAEWRSSEIEGGARIRAEQVLRPVIAPKRGERAVAGVLRCLEGGGPVFDGRADKPAAQRMSAIPPRVQTDQFNRPAVQAIVTIAHAASKAPAENQAAIARAQAALNNK
jgi:hypothetical protein